MRVAVALAYHRKIGRETTALWVGYAKKSLAYHRKIGRETTATFCVCN